MMTASCVGACQADSPRHDGFHTPDSSIWVGAALCIRATFALRALLLSRILLQRSQEITIVEAYVSSRHGFNLIVARYGLDFGEELPGLRLKDRNGIFWPSKGSHCV